MNLEYHHACFSTRFIMNEQEKVTQQHSLISGALRPLVWWASELIQTPKYLYFLWDIDIQQTIWRPCNGTFWNLAS